MAIVVNSFTLIDAINQFWKVCGDGDRRALTCAGLTYYYLCNVWNACGRPISFRRQNTLICAELFISKPTLEKHRNILKQHGIIDFFSKGRGDPNISYQIVEVKGIPEEVKKAKNFTSGFTSHFTSGDDIKQSTELFVVVEREVKKFDYLKNLFSADAGLALAWEQRFLPREKFEDGVLQWMIQNHGQPYETFSACRKHFLMWIPFYKIEQIKAEDHGKVNRSTTPAGNGKPVSGKAAGAIELAGMLREELASAGPGQADA